MYADTLYFGTMVLLILLITNVVCYYVRYRREKQLWVGVIILYACLCGCTNLFLTETLDTWTVLVLMGYLLSYGLSLSGVLSTFYENATPGSYAQAKLLIQLGILCSICSLCMLWFFQIIDIKALMGEW